MNHQSSMAAGAPVPDRGKDPVRLIARVIWSIVARDSGQDNRSLYLLDGIPGTVLTALSELGSEGYYEGGNYRLAIDAAIQGLDRTRMRPADLHEASPVRVRNEDFPGPVLLAARESEQATVPRGLR